jgi:hypothetical protein
MKILILHLFYLPLVVSMLRFNPIGNTPTQRARAPFFNARSKSKAAPFPATKPKAFPSTQEIIVIPSFLAVGSTYLVSITEIMCNIITMATKECAKISSNVAAFIAEKTHQVPKALNGFSKMCISIVKNTTEAMIEFTEHIAKGSLDLLCGTKAWMKTISSYTYCELILPLVKNTMNFISQVSEDISAWIEDVTLFTVRFTSMILEETSHFVTNFSLDIADFIQHYSIISYQIFITFMRFASLSLFQTMLQIPIWINDATQQTLSFVSFMVTMSKSGLVYFHNEFLELIEKAIDVAPFLIRYEEDGKEKVSLSPKAQMVLYILSSIYALQPLLTTNTSSMNR